MPVLVAVTAEALRALSASQQPSAPRRATGASGVAALPVNFPGIERRGGQQHFFLSLLGTPSFFRHLLLSLSPPVVRWWGGTVAARSVSVGECVLRTRRQNGPPSATKPSTWFFAARRVDGTLTVLIRSAHSLLLPSSTRRPFVVGSRTSPSPLQTGDPDVIPR